mmetsp:Transcript_13720/g.43162  ORF Transcript_13720/g.43162 Transcript_13720/m.43162 type:complete len:279 (-) Transcript_13720:1481-2317(-)
MRPPLRMDDAADRIAAVTTLPRVKERYAMLRLSRKKFAVASGPTGHAVTPNIRSSSWLKSRSRRTLVAVPPLRRVEPVNSSGPTTGTSTKTLRWGWAPTSEDSVMRFFSSRSRRTRCCAKNLKDQLPWCFDRTLAAEESALGDRGGADNEVFAAVLLPGIELTALSLSITVELVIPWAVGAPEEVAPANADSDPQSLAPALTVGTDVCARNDAGPVAAPPTLSSFAWPLACDAGLKPTRMRRVSPDVSTFRRNTDKTQLADSPHEMPTTTAMCCRFGR